MLKRKASLAMVLAALPGVARSHTPWPVYAVAAVPPSVLRAQLCLMAAGISPSVLRKVLTL